MFVNGRLSKYFLSISLIISISACGGSGSDSTEESQNENSENLSGSPAPIEPVSSDDPVTVVTVTKLSADGPNGTDTYSLIRNIFGEDSLEIPDIYEPEENHTETAHVWEETDQDIGHHFVFSAHRDLDWDRDKYPETQDRQRNEIKVYSGSDDQLKGFENEIVEYEFHLKIDEGMEVSTRFTHLFQLVYVTEDGSEPLMHITGSEQDGIDILEIRYEAETDNIEEILDTYGSWSDIQDEWLTIYLKATFSRTGSLVFSITRENGLPIIDIDRDNINLWPTGSEYVRPKWGIYRSLDDLDNLRTEEERVRYAEFTITKTELIE